MRVEKSIKAHQFASCSHIIAYIRNKRSKRFNNEKRKQESVYEKEYIFKITSFARQCKRKKSYARLKCRNGYFKKVSINLIKSLVC